MQRKHLTAKSGTELHTMEHVLLAILNTRYGGRLPDYLHPRGVKAGEFQTKLVLSIHITLRVSNFTNMKTKDIP